MAYSKGVIAIPSVTGNVVISVTTVASTPSYTDLTAQSGWTWSKGCRLNSQGTLSDAEGGYVTDYIPCAAGDVVRIKGLDITRTLGGATAKCAFYTTSKALAPAGTPNISSAVSAGIVTKGSSGEYKILAALYGSAQTADSKCAYMRFSGALEDGYTIDDVVITVNEEID